MKLQQSTLAALAMTVSSALGAGAEKPEAPGPKLILPKAPICKAAIKPAIMTSAQIFTIADKDGNGKLSAAEFDVAYKLILTQEKIKKASQVKPPKIKPVKPMPVAPPHPIGPGDGCPGCGLG